MPERKIERRYIPADEVRIKSNNNIDVLEGYAAVFNKWSLDLGGFQERIQKGTFKKTIQESDIRGLINHDPSLLLARTKSKTLRLVEDDNGLHYEMDLGNQSYVNDLRETIDRGDISGNSFQFQVIKDEWDKEFKKRTLLEVRLLDVGPVTFPAYPQTSLSMRSLFDEHGINFEILSGLMLRIDNGMKPENTDIEIINSTIEVLRHYLPEPEPNPMVHSTPISVLLKKLELTEKTF